MDHCCERTKHRTEAEKRALINRLSRIEGQVRGLKAMIEKDAYCVDLLTQASAASSALSAFSRQVLKSHLRTCVIEDIRKGDDQVVEELLDILQKMM